MLLPNKELFELVMEWQNSKGVCFVHLHSRPKLVSESANAIGGSVI